MINVSQEFKEAILSPERRQTLRVTLKTSSRTFELTGADLIENTLRIVYSVLSGDVLAPGSACMATITAALSNSGGVFDDVQLNNSTLTVYHGVKVTDTPIENETDDDFEFVPLSVFIINSVSRKINTPGRNFRSIVISGMDNMNLLARPFADVAVLYPISAGNLLTLVCQYCHMPRAVTSFLNSNYMINEAPTGELSCGNIVAAIAGLAGCWAQCSRAGLLEFRWFNNPEYVTEVNLDGNTDTADGGDFVTWNTKDYDGGVFNSISPDYTVGTQTRQDMETDDAPITITGVAIENEGGRIIAGSSRYAVVLDNPLIQDNKEEILLSIFRKISGFKYLPFSSKIRDDPSIEAGDTVLIENVAGRDYRTVITEYQYTYYGASQIAAIGLSEAAYNIGSREQTQYTRILGNIGQKQKQLNALDNAVMNASQLIAGIWGGFVINGDTLGDEKYKGNIFISDNADPEKAVKVWRWNLGGLGFSQNGIDGPYETAITADGSIVAGLITADMIQAGVLKSLNGESWINLDDGSLSLGDGALTWDKENGFESLSAKKLTTSGSTVWGTVGDIVNNEKGFVLRHINSTAYDNQVFYILASPGTTQQRATLVARGDLELISDRNISILSGAKLWLRSVGDLDVDCFGNFDLQIAGDFRINNETAYSGYVNTPSGVKRVVRGIIVND